MMVVALTSCVAPAKESEERDANGKKIEYVYYTPTGSNLPIRVRKADLKTTDKESAASQKLISDAQRMDTVAPPTSGGATH